MKAHKEAAILIRLTCLLVRSVATCLHLTLQTPPPQQTNHRESTTNTEPLKYKQRKCIAKHAHKRAQVLQSYIRGERVFAPSFKNHPYEILRVRVLVYGQLNPHH